MIGWEDIIASVQVLWAWLYTIVDATVLGQISARPLCFIGVGRFRILGEPRFRIWGGGPNSQQAHAVVTTSMRSNDVASTSFRRHVPTRFLINQCQIITFLILKYIIENSRIELRGIVLPVQVGGLLGGGGPKGMLPPPSQIIGGGGWPPLFLRLQYVFYLLSLYNWLIFTATPFPPLQAIF